MSKRKARTEVIDAKMVEATLPNKEQL